MEAQRRRRARKFLSTLSLRRATKLAFDGIYSDSISIHALLAESDFGIHRLYGAHHRFLSTLSLRRATSIRSKLGSTISISIHALLAESDFRTYGDVVQGIEFLSTLSLRRATIGPAPALQPQTFLSTLSLRRATQDNLGLTGTTAISIHALLAESDSPSATSRAAPGDFYPRSPCGERRH